MTDVIRILHVEDDPIFADITADWLGHQQDGLVVESVRTHHEGLDRLTEKDFDCIVADYALPKHDGISFLEDVREAYPDIPFILFTGKGSEAVASEAIEAGVSSYLQKVPNAEPYETLAKRITSLVESSTSHKLDSDTETTTRPITIHQHHQNQLEERIKELSTLRNISSAFESTDESLVNTLTSIVETLPEAFQYPTNTEARIRYEEYDVRTEDFVLDAVRHSHSVSIEGGGTLTLYIAVTGDHGRKGILLEEEIALLESVSIFLSNYLDRWHYLNELERTRAMLSHAEELGKTGAWEIRPATGEMYWTDGTRRIHGVSETYDPTADGILSFVHPDHRERVKKQLNEVTESANTRELRFPIIRPDGEERFIQVESMRVDQGEDIVIRGFVQDITEQQERERRLIRAKERLDLALKEAGAGIWEWNMESDELYWSDELLTLLGIDPDQYDDTIDTFENRLHPDDVEHVENAIAEAIETGEHYRVEQRILNAEGEYIWFDVRGLVMEERESPSMLGIGIDITERKKQEGQLQRQRDRLDEFASVVSHDLRNPLNIITGRIELAKEDCDSSHLESIESAASRMGELIDDLLNLARKGEQVDAVESIDLDELALECWNNVSTPKASIVIETDKTVLGDPVRLKQLLENLFRNAVEHGGDDVSISVGSSPGGFFVEDDGKGIPPDKRAKVFEAGYSTSSDGTGFGLSIVKQIAEAHGWSIRIEEGTNGGARFVLEVDNSLP